MEGNRGRERCNRLDSTRPYLIQEVDTATQSRFLDFRVSLLIDWLPFPLLKAPAAAGSGNSQTQKKGRWNAFVFVTVTETD